MNRKREQFASMLAARLPVLGVGAHNPLTATLAELAGFDLLWLSSLELTASRMLPDANLISFSDVVPVLSGIAMATGLPIIVDGDNGYGSDQATYLAARHFEQAGASAICIEDNAFPKSNSFFEKGEHRLEDVNAFCRRIEAARAGSSNLVVIARTEALVAGLGPSEAITRARAYVEAGAGAIFIQTKRDTFPQYQTALEQVKGIAPVLLTPTAVPDWTTEQLHALGIDIVIHANLAVRALVHALRDVFARVQGGACLAELESQICSMSDVLDLTHREVA